MDQNVKDISEVIAQIEDWKDKNVTYEQVTGGITNPNWLSTKMARLRYYWPDPRLDYWLGLLKGDRIFTQFVWENG